MDTTTFGWIPLEAGQAFKPISLPKAGPRRLLLRVEPGTVVALHRHHGEVHSLTLSGTRRLLDPAGQVEVAAGTYVYEPAGSVDSWMAMGNEPCIVYIAIEGAMDTLDQNGMVIASTGTADLRRAYIDWCATQGTPPIAALADV